MKQYLEYGFENKVAVVTGAGSGIGASCALELAKGGAKLSLFGRRTEKLEETRAKCLAYSDDVLTCPLDVSDKAAVSAGVDTVLKAFGQIDILVNNAGFERTVEPGKSIFEDYFTTESPEEYLRYFEVHTLGHYLMNLAVLPSMRSRKFGRVVNISSVLGVDGNYDTPGYSASKGAAITQTKSFARRFGGDGITFNAVLPGMVNTPMKSDAPAEEFEIVRSITPLGYIAEPIDIARAVLFFAQEHLFVTGQTLIVSGGSSIY
jgi:NAD(P)-dependent dehydrogenase (short-subunit alcohol dehydrogenase family)